MLDNIFSGPMGGMIEQAGVRDVNEVEKKTDSIDHLLIIKVLRES